MRRRQKEMLRDGNVGVEVVATKVAEVVGGAHVGVVVVARVVAKLAMPRQQHSSAECDQVREALRRESKSVCAAMAGLSAAVHSVSASSLSWRQREV